MSALGSKRVVPNKKTKAMFTVSQVATQLQLSKQSVYVLVQQGKLKAHRFGAGRGTIRISSADLEEFIEASRQQPTEPLQQTRRIEKPRLKHIRL